MERTSGDPSQAVMSIPASTATTTPALLHLRRPLNYASLRLYRKAVIANLFKVGGITMIFIALIILLLRMISLVELLLNRVITPRSFFQILLYVLPEIITVCLPIALMVASTVVYGQMRNSRSMVALQAAGVSHFQLMRPVIDVYMILLPLIMLNTFAIAPWSERQIRIIRTLDPVENFSSVLSENQFSPVGVSTIAYIGDMNQDTGAISQIFIYNRLISGLDLFTLAQQATIDAKNNILRISLQNGALQALANNSLLSQPERMLDLVDPSIRDSLQVDLEQIRSQDQILEVVANFDRYLITIDPTADGKLNQKTIYEIDYTDFENVFFKSDQYGENVLEYRARAIERFLRVLMPLQVLIVAGTILVLWRFQRGSSLVTSIAVIGAFFAVDLPTYNINAGEAGGSSPLGLSVLVPLTAIVGSLLVLWWFDYGQSLWIRARSPRTSQNKRSAPNVIPPHQRGAS